MNLAKLDEAIAWAETHPEQHDQSRWFVRTDCGTAACLAGTMAILGGWKPVDWYRWDDGSESTVMVSKGDRKFLVDMVALSLIDPAVEPDGAGAVDHPALQLFGAQNTLDDIKRIRDELAGEL
jgi:hypothetical protein